MDSAQIAIIQQVTGCTASKAKLVINRLSEYAGDPPSTGMNRRFDISTQTAATLCGVCKHTFLKYASDNPSELPRLQIGNGFKFSRVDVQAFINRRIQSSTESPVTS